MARRALSGERALRALKSLLEISQSRPGFGRNSLDFSEVFFQHRRAGRRAHAGSAFLQLMVVRIFCFASSVLSEECSVMWGS